MSDRSGSRRGVLFDVDGTLVDDNYLHVVAWWRAFRAHGHDVTMTELHRHIGQGSDVLVREVLGRDDEALVKAHTHFYGPSLEQLRLLPGARDVLAACKERGLTVVLATSAAADEVEMLTAALDSDDVIDVVTGADDADEAKPDPDILQTAMDKAGLDASDCVMVGDTVWDVEAAQRAGLPCIAVLSGGIGRDELEAAGAVAVYRDVAELHAHIDDGPIGALAKAAAATG